MSIEFPNALKFLLTESARYKVLYGGRGAGKTENIALALLILTRSRRLRVACFRELQKSIGESVHATIKQKIFDLGWESEFTITDKSITHNTTGSEFIFSGLRYNIDSVKSMARIDIAWVEEANNVTKVSWDKLGPTIRGRHESDPNGMGGPFGSGPEIWISFNPELDTDETYVRFVLNKLPEYDSNGNKFAIVCKVNWSDNKWFPNDLMQEMRALKIKSEDDWLHVWEGHTKQVLDGAIYAEEIKQVLLDKRRGRVAYDPSRPVHTFWDLGHSDHTAIWFVQQVGMHYNVINYFQHNLKKFPFYLEYMQSLKYNYGNLYLPHDADNETLASRSIAKMAREAYPGKVKIVPRVAKKVLGIRAARVIFELCNFDEANTSDGWQCLTRYKYAVNESGTFSKEPEHNEYSHGADAFQTFALSLKSETAMAKKSPEAPKKHGVVISLHGRTNGLGWMG